MSKVELRAEIRARLRSDPRRDGAAVADRLREAFPGAVLCGYLAMPDELDLDAFMSELAAADRLVLPRVEGASLRLLRVRDLGAQVEGERTRQPRAGLPAGAPDVVLVPGRAFDRRGARLGRGGGHYDRLLAAMAGVLSVGVCLDAQVVDEVPEEPWDRRVQAVLTPSGWQAGGYSSWKSYR